VAGASTPSTTASRSRTSPATGECMPECMAETLLLAVWCAKAVGRRGRCAPPRGWLTARRLTQTHARTKTPPPHSEGTGLSARVARMNPRWNEPKCDQAAEDARFEAASAACGVEFGEQLAALTESCTPARHSPPRNACATVTERLFRHRPAAPRRAPPCRRHRTLAACRMWPAGRCAKAWHRGILPPAAITVIESPCVQGTRHGALM
jgi:hypothetical protein